MKIPAYPDNEISRLCTLRSLNLLDTSPEERFDRLTRLAKHLFSVPIALISLVDENRQWFKSCQGLDVHETSRDVSFCAHSILKDGILVIPNALNDPRFFDNPLVISSPNIRFYAGVPLVAPDGSKLGTFCLIDDQPRQFSCDEQKLLKDFGCLAEQEIFFFNLATIDELTQIPNRRAFSALAMHSLHLCKRLEKPACLLFFDLDFFKEINDTYGHAMGDRALKDFARLLQQTFRESDVIGRLGGDEFVVLLTNSSQVNGHHSLIRLKQAIQRYNQSSHQPYTLHYSVGVVEFCQPYSKSLEDLFAIADQSMYLQKRARRDRGKCAIVKTPRSQKE